MARSSWWEKITKNDWQEPSNMTKGEVTAIYNGAFTLFLFMMIYLIYSVLSINDSILFVTSMLAVLLLGLSMALYTYIRAAILPHKDNKRYVAGCTTILISAWISVICAILYACGLQWDGYSLITAVCMMVNASIALIYSVRANRQAKQEGKPVNSLALLIHMGWGFMPVAANLWFII